MTKNVLAYLKKVVGAKYIRCDRESTFVGGSLYTITYISQDDKTLQATINAEDVGNVLYKNYGDIFKDQAIKQYGPLNLSKMLEYTKIKHPRHLTKTLDYIPVENQIIEKRSKEVL